MKVVVTVGSIEATLALGSAIGSVLRGGETIELVSDLGGGKTTFVKGLAAGLGSHDTVQSPSFTISRVYQCYRDLTLHHFDFYRLHHPGVMAGELAESLAQKETIVVVEWGEIVADILPKNRVQITIEVVSEHARKFTIAFPTEHKELAGAIRHFQKENA